MSEFIDAERVCCAGLILAELLQGAKSEREIQTLREFPHVFEFLPESVGLWEKAGMLSRRMIKKGSRIGLSDCYLAVMALENDVTILTLDKDFNALAEETGLKLHAL